MLERLKERRAERRERKYQGWLSGLPVFPDGAVPPPAEVWGADLTQELVEASLAPPTPAVLRYIKELDDTDLFDNTPVYSPEIWSSESTTEIIESMRVPPTPEEQRYIDELSAAGL